MKSLQLLRTTSIALQTSQLFSYVCLQFLKTIVQGIYLSSVPLALNHQCVAKQKGKRF